MKRVTVREFQLHASKYLKELPIVLTVYGKWVAYVTDSVNKREKSVDTFPDRESLLDKVVIKKPRATFNPIPKKQFKKKGKIGFGKKINPEKLKRTLKKLPGFCKHGRKIGLCEFGCTK